MNGTAVDSFQEIDTATFFFDTRSELDRFQVFDEIVSVIIETNWRFSNCMTKTFINNRNVSK